MPNPLLQSDFSRRANVYRQALNTVLDFGPEPSDGPAEVVDALAGNDVITNERLPYAAQIVLPQQGYAIWLFNRIRLLLGQGNDTLSARGFTSGLAMVAGAQLDAGPGHDTVTGLADANAFGFASIGVNLESETTLQLGSGNDVLTAQGAEYGLLMANNPFYPTAVQTRSFLDAGSGNDRIEAVGVFIGAKLVQADLLTGAGNDRVLLSGERAAIISELSSISLGSGNDHFSAIGSQSGMLLEKGSRLDAGAGNDVLIASDGQGFRTSLGLVDGSTILMGAGNDTVDALTGVFRTDFVRSSWVDLGEGRDTFKGFGDGLVRGGAGQDRLVLADGNYTVSVADAALNPLPAGFSGLQIEQGRTKLFVESMELLAGTADRRGVNLTTGFFYIVGGEAFMFA